MLNIEKMKQKMSVLKGENKNTSENGINYWKPVENKKYTVRILPVSSGDPFREYYLHYGVGKEHGFLCPKRNFDQDCPVCTFATQLYKDRDKEAGNLEMAKQLFAKARFYSPIIVREEMDKGPLVWSYSRKVYEQLLELVLNPDYGDITDIHEGYDLYVTFSKTGNEQYKSAKITPRPKPVPVCEDQQSDDCKKLLDAIPDLNNLMPAKSSVEVQAILDAALLEDDGNPEGSEQEKSFGEAQEQVGAVDQAFAELSKEVEA